MTPASSERSHAASSKVSIFSTSEDDAEGAGSLQARHARSGSARLEHARDGRLRIPRQSAPHAGGDAPKVVFCTTENDVAHIARALHAGANEYIMKPFDKDIVTAKFQEVGLL